MISKLLKKAGVVRNVLNAGFHEQEAQIIAEAGVPGMVTIGANMAGRGTDIQLEEILKNIRRLLIKVQTYVYQKKKKIKLKKMSMRQKN